MPILGAHQTIAGGYYRAADVAAETTCECVQLFTRNNAQWKAKPISAEDAARFQAALAKHGILHPLSHASYLINLAAADDALWKKSIAGMVLELDRATQLGIPFVVMHPGAHTSLTRKGGLARIVAALDAIHAETPQEGARILLENTAGQGSNLGWQFSDLAEILSGVRESDRLGVCIDTCHAFAAGYDLSCEEGYEAAWEEFERLVGLPRIQAMHLNDSKRELGSRVDRHEHIGQGRLGSDAFRRLLRDPRFAALPMYLETPKGDHEGRPWDVINLETLRKLGAE